jgi:hypothetical protein
LIFPHAAQFVARLREVRRVNLREHESKHLGRQGEPAGVIVDDFADGKLTDARGRQNRDLPMS